MRLLSLNSHKTGLEFGNIGDGVVVYLARDFQGVLGYMELKPI